MTFTGLKIAVTIGLLSISTTLQAQHSLGAAPELLYDDEIISKVEFGIVCPAGELNKLPAPDTHLGFINERQETQRIEHKTQIIPLTRGIGFGVDVKLPWRTKLSDVEISVFHPPFVGTDVTQGSWRTDFRPRKSNLNFFMFEFPFELVEGDWAIQATHEGKTLYAVSFKVVDPSHIPNLPNYCAAGLLS